MGIGVLFLAGIVLCISLLARLIISQFFTHQVFDSNSSMPLVPGINESLFEEQEYIEPAFIDENGQDQNPVHNGRESKEEDTVREYL